jgi:hypothetical protein
VLWLLQLNHRNAGLASPAAEFCRMSALWRALGVIELPLTLAKGSSEGFAIWFSYREVRSRFRGLLPTCNSAIFFLARSGFGIAARRVALRHLKVRLA